MTSTSDMEIEINGRRTHVVPWWRGAIYIVHAFLFGLPAAKAKLLGTTSEAHTSPPRINRR